MLEFDLSATAADGTNQQTRTFGGMRGTCRQMGLEYFDKHEIMANVSQKCLTCMNPGLAWCWSIVLRTLN